ncbi:MAG: hypothetical protein NTV80_05635 [Verrucomicrobia bacterium]|nr:hypothetical protein [Verrucomicrobiota bacterium]
MQILSSIKTVREQPEQDDFVDDKEIIVVPKATELIIALRKESFKFSTVSIIQSISLIGYACFLFYRNDTTFSYLSFIFLVTPIFIILHERWEWQQRREKLIIELLGQLVSDNNRLRKLLPNDPSRL